MTQKGGASGRKKPVFPFYTYRKNNVLKIASGACVFGWHREKHPNRQESDVIELLSNAQTPLKRRGFIRTSLVTKKSHTATFSIS